MKLRGCTISLTVLLVISCGLCFGFSPLPISSKIRSKLSPPPPLWSSKEVVANGDTADKNQQLKDTTDDQKQQQRRRMELTCCTRERCNDVIRERVVGDENENKFEFESPATGQVSYSWRDDDKGDSMTRTQTVLLLVKRDDDDLVHVAAKTIRQLTESKKIRVLLSPDLYTRLGKSDDFGELISDEQGYSKVAQFQPAKARDFDANKLVRECGLKEKYTSRSPDIVCTLGGDGLLMHAGMLFQGPCPPIMCVAGGSLGFLTPFTKNEMVEAIMVALGLVQSDKQVEETDPLEIRPSYKSFLKSHSDFKLGVGGRICISMRMRLDARVIDQEGKVKARFNVLNEIVIDRGASPYLAALECFVDDLHLTTVQADGVIFATPTGSTAYSMAAGGSVVHPAVPGILVTPICPHVLSFRSMIFPDSVVLRCYVPDDARAEASVAFDGRYRHVLGRGDSVQIQMSQHPVPTINRADHSSDWLWSLKEDFNFNARKRQKPD